MQIKMAKETGYCWGVDLAMEMVDKALAESAPPVCSLGPIIHNPLTIRSLEARDWVLPTRSTPSDRERSLSAHMVFPRRWPRKRKQGGYRSSTPRVPSRETHSEEGEITGRGRV